MNFEMLGNLYSKLEEISSGNELRKVLADFFKKVSIDDIDKISLLTLGKIASDFDSVILGIAEKSVLKSIALVAGFSQTKVKELVQKKGDAGIVAEELLLKKPKTLIPIGDLSVVELFDSLHKIAKISGNGSQEKKMVILSSLLQKAKPKDAKYVVRIVLGDLRLGVGDMTVLDALSIAFTGDKSNKEILENAYNICPDVGLISKTLAKNGLNGVRKIDVSVGRPIKMMLAQRVKKIEEIKEKMPGSVTVEGKYDGERIQAHKNKDIIKLFSRRLDNVTEQFPDVVKYLEKFVKAKEFVLEGEVIAVDSNGNLLSFQTLMQRKRKHNIIEYVKKIPVVMKCFDLLYCDGKSYLKESYVKRNEKLKKIISKNKHILLVDSITTDNINKIEEFFHKMLEDGNEGIIVKSRADDSYYQAGTRGWNWIKWKKDYAKDMVDTFDLVIVGAFFGRGKRGGSYGALLCAVYNKNEDMFETICKLGSGLTDEVLEDLPKKLSKHKVNKKPARIKVKKEMIPDVWFNPKIVVEVLAAEITKSPYHSLGLALRFPRFLKFRDNKKAEQATTDKEIKEMK